MPVPSIGSAFPGGNKPTQTGGKSILDKLGDRLKVAHEKFKNETTTNGDVGLPAGIEGGVAQLVDMRFVQVKEGKQNAGEWTFYAAGVVKQPKIFNNQIIYGGRTSITEPMYDSPTLTRKTVDAHVQRLYQILRSFGINTAELQDFKSVMAVMSALVKAKPHFAFRTWKGEKQKTGPYKDREPRVNHQWGDMVDFVEEEHTGTEGVEGSAENNPEIPDVQDEENPESDGQAVEPAGTEETGEVAIGEFNEFEDLQSLIDAATGEDESAQEKLKQMAIEAGLSEEDVATADSWEAVGEMIVGNAKSDSGGEEEPEPPAKPEPFKPEKGRVCLYYPMDKRTRKPSKKPVEVEPIVINAKEKTVDLKNLTNTKVIYKSIPWDRLTPLPR